MNLATGI